MCYLKVVMLLTLEQAERGDRIRIASAKRWRGTGRGKSVCMGGRGGGRGEWRALSVASKQAALSVVSNWWTS